MTAHWGVADPAAFEGSQGDQRLLFHRSYLALSQRIERFLKLPIESLDRSSLQSRLDDIGGNESNSTGLA